MANFRQIHVSIWKDEWFLDLEPDEKLLFIYLFSNEATSISGLYKLALKVIAFETGLPVKRINEILKKFGSANKVHYDSGLVWVVNMSKYHVTKSDRVITRVQNDLALIPDCRLKIAYQSNSTPDAQDDTVSIPYPYPMDREQQLKEYKDNKNHGAKNAPSPLWNTRNELTKYFMQKTGLPMNGDEKAKQKLWWSPSDEIYKLAGEDIDKAKEIIDRAIIKLRDVTIADMNSIIKTARAVYSEDHRPDQHQYDVVD